MLDLRPQRQNGSAPLELRRTQSLAFHFNRPYFDLGPASQQAPHHARALDLIGTWMERGAVDRPGPQMEMTPVFRSLLVRESGLWEYGDGRPETLAPELRSARWQCLVERLARWEALPARDRLSTGRVLVSLTCQRRAVELLWPPVVPDGDAPAEAASLAVLAFAAANQLGWGSRRQLVDGLTALVAATPQGTLARYSAGLLLAGLAGPRSPRQGKERSTHARFTRLHRELEAGRSALRAADWLRVSARAHALEAKLLGPHDPAGAAVALDEAEARLTEIAPEDTDDRQLVDEALRRLTDRRCLLAHLAGDLDAALVHAGGAVDLDPWDSKAWLLRGNVLLAAERTEEALAAFRRAARLGPLFTAQAWFMHGQALERLERHEEAVDSYLVAMRTDGTATAPAVALAHCARRLHLPPLAEFARRAATSLEHHLAVAGGAAGRRRWAQ